MVADNAKRMGYVIAVTFAITACGGSALRTSNAKDSGTTSPDLGSKGDLPADNNPVYQDAATDAGVVPADAGPDTPSLGREIASPDTTIIENDAGRDGNIIRKDTVVDGVAQDVATDNRDDSSILAIDGGGVDSGLTASLTVSPGPFSGPYGSAYYIASPENSASSAIFFTVSNVGTTASGTFTITITGTDASSFEITSNSCDKPLPAGEGCQVAVVFNARLSDCFASLNIVADGFPGGALAVPLIGETA